jgi:hypothetical protein
MAERLLGALYCVVAKVEIIEALGRLVEAVAPL